MCEVCPGLDTEGWLRVVVGEKGQIREMFVGAQGEHAGTGGQQGGMR